MLASNFSVSNGAAAINQPWEDRPDLPSDGALSLQDRCADVLLRTIFRFDKTAFQKECGKALSLPKAANSHLLKIVSRIPTIADERFSFKTYISNEKRLKNAIDRFDEFGEIDERLKRFIQKDRTLREFVGALQERYGCLVPFDDIDDTRPFDSNVNLKDLRPYPTYDHSQRTVMRRKITSVEEYTRLHKEGELGNLPLYPDRVYSHPGYGGKWASYHNFFHIRSRRPTFVAYDRVVNLLRERSIQPQSQYRPRWCSWVSFLHPKS